MAGLTVAFSLDMGGWAAAGVLAVALGGGCLWFRHEARQARKDAVLWESSARGALASLEELSAAADRRGKRAGGASGKSARAGKRERGPAGEDTGGEALL